MTARGTHGDRILNCLVYVPNIYNGAGTTQSLVWIVERFEQAGIRPLICFERTWQFPRRVESASLFPPALRGLPGRLTRFVPKVLLERAFLKLLSRHSPSDTFVYLWPQPRSTLIEAIKKRGFCVFRELINCPGHVYVAEVSRARRNAGLDDRHPPNVAAMQDEFRQFQLCDYLTAPNAEVEQALLSLGIPASKIVPTSFGWARERFCRFPLGLPERPGEGKDDRPFTVLFVGHLEARKGAHYLAEAWQGMPPGTRLQLVGTVDPEMAPSLARWLTDERIVHIPFTSDLEPVFRSADVFAFPSVEEGGPQVTLEAAGCGLPVVTTAMGAARIIVDGRNGLIVPSHDVGALREALLDLYRNPQKRAALARQAERDAEAFTYERVGAARAALFRDKFSEYSRAWRLPEGRGSKRAR